MSDDRLRTLMAAGTLAIGGLLLLLFNLNLFTAYEPQVQYLLALGVAAGGGGFFLAYFSDRSNWWRLIPGWTLLALAGMIMASTVATVDQRIPAAILFVGLALAFAHIYLLNQAENWWAIIPGGFMLVLAVVITANVVVERTETIDTILFVGMGLVFFVLYLLTDRRRQWWALIPGTVLLVFGLFVFTVDEGGGVALRWWPLLLMSLGLFVGWRAWRRPPPEKLISHSAPASRRATASAPASGGANRRKDKAPANLGDYSRPAPGASIEILPDPDDQ